MTLSFRASVSIRSIASRRPSGEGIAKRLRLENVIPPCLPHRRILSARTLMPKKVLKDWVTTACLRLGPQIGLSAARNPRATMNSQFATLAVALKGENWLPARTLGSLCLPCFFP